jgi:hypothetical protein
MDEETRDKIEEIVDQYWHDFSDLVSKTLEKIEPEHRAVLAMRLQESSSVYGRKTSK